MSLENMVRGSGDLGASICTAWGLRQVDPVKNSVYVQNLKPRDFQPCEAFVIQGRPSIDATGGFEMTHPPGFAGELSDHLDRKGGKPETPGKEQKIADIKRLQAEGLSCEQIAAKIGVSKRTVSKWARL